MIFIERTGQQVFPMGWSGMLDSKQKWPGNIQRVLRPFSAAERLRSKKGHRGEIMMIRKDKLTTKVTSDVNS